MPSFSPALIQTMAALAECILKTAAGGHVWTAPAVQEESEYQRSVRVRSCIRPWCGRLAAGPDVIR
jgi:hypothetical protein